MPADEKYDVALMESAADGVADTEDEAKELLHFAKPTSMMTKEEQIVMFAKVLRDDRKAQVDHTEELKRTNDIIETMAQNWTSVVKHAIGCLNRITNVFIEAIKRPYVLVPMIGFLGFLVLVVIGQGDQGMDILVSLIEKYADVDVHGHAKAVESAATPGG